MPVHKRGDRWHYAFCIRGVRYRGALPEARTKFQAAKAETKIRQDVYEGRYGRATGEMSFEKFVEDVYKPWARENKRSFENNEVQTADDLREQESQGQDLCSNLAVATREIQEGATRVETERWKNAKASTINRED